ncbi:MAG: phosphoribosylaminoimidazolesuccinocarboxamide synthase [Gemmatimonadetes bacterium]|nr:phosphoribosylaminoimidazolesuccinocarboxamide synthase [Gemmatimonadota bacterium]
MSDVEHTADAWTRGGEASNSAARPVVRSSTGVVERTELPFPLYRGGKVREVYDLGRRLLIVASDRISAFDVVLPQPIPRKGEVLTQLTAWWLSQLEDLVDHHLVAVDPDRIVTLEPRLRVSREVWTRRAMLVQRTEPIPIECVVRGYISGSAWREYRERGTLAGEPLPPGLIESQRLEPAIFSPATKAVDGHDENIAFVDVARRVGAELAERLRTVSLALYERGAGIAQTRGIVVADTKFEFGQTRDGRLLLIDEVLTPDSSRFWPADLYEPGRAQPSFDKQPVRDYLDGLRDWDKRPPSPPLPPEVVAATSSRYLEIFRRLTGTPLDDFRAPEAGGAA